MVRIPFNFDPRPYQLPFLRAMDEGKRRAVLVWHRRAGKDKCIWNYTIREAMRRVGSYYYFFPTYAQARKTIWDGKDKAGFAFLDHIPREIRKGDPNSTEMKVFLSNGSLVQLVGSDNIDSIMGTNPVGCVFSEYSLSDPRGWDFVRPILRENGGWAIFPFTPRGKNHGHTLFEMARKNADWFCERLTVDDTYGRGGTVGKDDVEAERQSGMRENLIEQEFYCSFDAAVENAVWGDEIYAVRREKRLCRVPWEPRVEVETYWDIGWDDATAIWFVQQVRNEIRVIDYYESRLASLEHYIKTLRERPYVYGRHVLPHDAGYRDMKYGKSTQEAAAELGLFVEIGQKLNKEDQIQSARSVFPRCWFDEDKASKGFDALASYHFGYDEQKKVLSRSPVHDWASHACFVGDTKVLIRNETQRITVCPISCVPNNVEVLTPCGWKRCTKSWITRKDARLVEVRFSGGYTVRCTPDHPFLTDSGWKSAGLLLPNTPIRSTLTQSRSISTAAYTACGLAKDTFLAAARSFIATFGRPHLVPCLTSATSTTKTGTFSTTRLRILSVSPQMSTSLFRTSTASSPRMPETKRQSGTDQRKVGCGTAGTQSERNRGPSGSALRRYASTAIVRLLVSKGRADRTKFTAASRVEYLRIESVTEMQERQDVWCLNVPDGQCFSLENGAVVHNSDAYMLMAQSLRPVVKATAIKYPAMGIV